MLSCKYLQKIADEFDSTLKRKELELYNTLPTHLLYNPAPGELADADAQIFYSKHEMRLDHLLNVFLVERLLLKHGHPRTDLLRTSFEMVVLTLRLWTHKHRWAEIPGESQRLVSSDALSYSHNVSYDAVNWICSPGRGCLMHGTCRPQSHGHYHRWGSHCR